MNEWSVEYVNMFAGEWMCEWSVDGMNVIVLHGFVQHRLKTELFSDYEYEPYIYDRSEKDQAMHIPATLHSAHSNTNVMVRSGQRTRHRQRSQ